MQMKVFGSISIECEMNADCRTHPVPLSITMGSFPAILKISLEYADNSETKRNLTFQLFCNHLNALRWYTSLFAVVVIVDFNRTIKLPEIWIQLFAEIFIGLFFFWLLVSVKFTVFRILRLLMDSGSALKYKWPEENHCFSGYTGSTMREIIILILQNLIRDENKQTKSPKVSVATSQNCSKLIKVMAQ